jgi:NADPH:quinone reductase-like Zn-dependent oxidoreductase
MDSIPSAVYLTSYSGDTEDYMRTPLDELASQVEAGKLRINVGRVFHLEQIADAHRAMEENKAEEKIVVLT